MASKNAVIIGGTGLIGSYLAADLVRAGHRVSVLSRSTRFSAPEALLEGTGNQIQDQMQNQIQDQIQMIHGEHSDESLLVDVLSRADIVFHKTLSQGASGAVENGQQFLQNKLGAACALTAALKRLKRKPELLVLGSSVVVYGEGAYQCAKCGTVRPELRYAIAPEDLNLSERQADYKGEQAAQASEASEASEAKEARPLRSGGRQAPGAETAAPWNPRCPSCLSQELTPLFLDEKAARRGESIYAVEKKAEEDLIAAACKQTGINLSVLRYSTVIGAGQSWHSPFTHFLDVLYAGEQPSIHEDGRQTRDFMFVRDAAQANMQALEKHLTGVHFYNIASGQPRTMLDFLEQLAKEFAETLADSRVPQTVRTDLKLMPGDVRHCYISGAKAEKELAFVARQDFRQGLKELVDWYLVKKGIGRKSSSLAHS